MNSHYRYGKWPVVIGKKNSRLNSLRLISFLRFVVSRIFSYFFYYSCLKAPLHETDRHMLYDPNERRIRSFVTRAGRLSTAQARAIESLGPSYCLPFQKSALAFDSVFQRPAPTILEIGTGMGETTAFIAGHLPDKNFLGVEVHTPGIGSLLKLIGEQSLTNLRLIQHDAVEVVRDVIAPNSLACMHVFFPDPWHNARPHKRRLLQGSFVELLTSCLMIGRYLHVAAAWQGCG